MIHTKKELREHIEEVFDINLFGRSKKDVYVNARAIYFNILQERFNMCYQGMADYSGVGLFAIRNYINGTIIDIKRDRDWNQHYQSIRNYTYQRLTLAEENELLRKENDNLRELIRIIRNN
jgi:hypothetical protein